MEKLLLNPKSLATFSHTSGQILALKVARDMEQTMAMPLDHSAVGEVTSNVLTYLWADLSLESGERHGVNNGNASRPLSCRGSH